MTPPILGPDEAAAYDSEQADMFDPAVLDPTVDVLFELAGGGPVLELAVGTGRVALPLAAKGIAVSGVELSPHMAAILEEKPSSDLVTVTVRDMTTARVPGLFRLVYLVFNSIMDLTTQDLQVDAFRNAAAHLEPGGRFVVEVFLPHALRPTAMAGTPQLLGIEDEEIVIGSVDRIAQVGSTDGWRAAGDRLVKRPRRVFRYVYPSELDLMARLAGLRLQERWAGWDRSPITAASDSQIAVFASPPDGR